MNPNVYKFFLFELPIITFFFNLDLIMTPIVNNFFLSELPIIMFF